VNSTVDRLALINQDEAAHNMQAIRRTGTVGIGKITMRANATHLAGIKVVGDALVLDVMRFVDELVDVSTLDLPSDAGVRPQELHMAEQLVANLTEAFDPSKYSDEYRANLLKIIRAKLKGKKIDVEEPEEPQSTQVVDLMARLQESLEMGKQSHRGAKHAAKHRSARAHHTRAHPATRAARKRKSA